MVYGCIGGTLKHSFSKEIHAMLSSNPYELKELKEEELEAFFKERDFVGINVTIPYKQAVIPFLDEISPEAKEIGAVNTIVNREGKLYGYNTDVFGLSELLGRLHASPVGRKVAILGSGGTSLTAMTVVKRLGGEPIRVSRSGKEGTVSYAEFPVNYPGICGIIDTTPVGMYPHADDELIVNLDQFPRLEFLADVVYRPLRTNFVLEARRRGIPADTGLYMLVAQGVRASELFLDCTYPEGTCDRIFETLFREKENIVLVGMPGSGKSTVGKLLAEKAGRTFLDLDREIERVSGKTIPEIFAESGEEGFRNVETEVIKEVSDLSSCVIATGGGAILRDVNVTALKRNGKLYFLDRPLEKLIPTDDRPLSRSREEIEALYSQRYDRYCRVCDFRADGDGTPEEVAEIVRKDFFGA